MKSSAATAVATIHTPSPGISSVIERVLSDPSFPIERVEQTFAFYQKVEADRASKAWSSAFVSAQAAMAKVKKDANNPQTKSRYVTFEALDSAIRPIYSSHGFAPSFDTEESPKADHIRVVLYLIHSEGHERRYHIDMPADGKGAKGGDVMTKTHAAGSAMSYGKRYLLGSAFNVVTTSRDDDGNAAGGDLSVVDDEQAEELTRLITKTCTNLDQFLRVAKAESVSDVLAKDFAGLRALLLKKVAKS